MRRKKISGHDIIGEQGIALIHQRVSEMGLIWRPMGVDAGVDGTIEIRDAASGEVSNCLIQVQSKATSRSFDRETEQGFEYTCDERDLEYWLHGNAPVILVRSRPSTNEAYWVSLKDYFQDLDRCAKRKVVFDKARDRFDLSCRDALVRLAIPADSGLYLAPPPLLETLHSNLLPVAKFPRIYYVADTEFRTREQLWGALREMDADAGSAWSLKDRKIFSFHNLAEYPWSDVCDRGTLERFYTEEWATYEGDPAEERAFVQLLNATLREVLSAIQVRFDPRQEHYYFRATRDLRDRTTTYTSKGRRVTRTVFQAYSSKQDPRSPIYFRHSAFRGYFVHYGGTWYLQINPTYRFTRDGWTPSVMTADLLSGIKRLERNEAVYGQVKMWARLLADSEFFGEAALLQFGQLQDFQIQAGIHDDAWIKSPEASDEPSASEKAQLPLL